MSLYGEYDPENIFAKILRGEMSCVKVFEDAAALAFMDLFPQSPGHTLVISKEPVRNFLEMKRETVGPYLETVQRVGLAVAEALKPDGVQIMQFNGGPSGQSVFHVHFHIIPRYGKGPLGIHALGPKAELETLQTQAEKIAAAIR